jgi:hypothetical protein
MDFVATIQREWPVISQAPWSIGAIGIAFLGMGGVVGYFLGNERIRNLLSRVEHRNDEISELKRKLAELLSNSPDRKTLRLTLSEFIVEGETLQKKCRVEGGDLPTQEIGAWANRIVDFLSEKLDQSYVRRLRSNAGLSPVAPVGNLTNDQQNLWKLVNHRIERLNQFLSELS